MRIPDFTAIGQVPQPQPANAVASYNPNAPFEAQQQTGADVEKSGQQIQDLYDTAFVNDAANQFATQNRQVYGDYLSKQGKDAVDGFPQAQAQMESNLDQQKEGMTGRQADQFSQMARSRMNVDLDRMAMYRDTQAKDYAQQTTNATLTNYVNDNYTYYNDDTRSTANLAAGNSIIAAHGQQSGWSPAMVEQRQNKFTDDMSSARSSAAVNYVASLPVDQQLTALQPLMDRHAGTAPTTPNDAISFVMNKLEGAQLVQNDSGHGPSKYGIVGSMNGLSPDQVANLSPDQAAQIYKTKYWDAAGIDDLPDNMKLVGFDTAVNFGVQQAKKMITEANGDPQKLLTIRQDQYEELADQDPARYGPAEASWANRNNLVAHAMLQGSGQPVGDWRDAIDPGNAAKLYKGAQTQQKLEQASQDDATKQQQETRMNQYFGQVANKGSFDAATLSSDPLLTEEQKMRMLEMQDKLKKLSDDGVPVPDTNDPAVIKQRGILENMKVDDPQGFQNFDFTSLAGKLPGAEIAKFQGDAAAMHKGDAGIAADNKQAKLVTDSVIDMLPLAWQHPKTDSDEQEASAFKGQLIAGARDAQAASGNPIGRDDVRKMASDMLGAKVAGGQDVTIPGGGWFGGSSTVHPYQVPPGTNPLSVYQGTPDNIYVPDTFRLGFARAWQTKIGAPPSEQDIRRGYLKSVQPAAQ